MQQDQRQSPTASMKRPLRYERTQHAAARTGDYAFNQLIPYIGNKRKLLDLIQEALASTLSQRGATFLDLFAGSGVVSRLAKVLGYRVIANDWEPYAKAINACYIGCNSAPPFSDLGGCDAAIEALNTLPPRVDWVSEHLCPRDDKNYDPAKERLFFMRKNGMRIDAIRHQIAIWKQTGAINDAEECCLLAPLLYQVCYTSNTSGVFKGFHNGWGGQTGTALYRIAGDLRLAPSVFYDNGQDNQVLCQDAQAAAEQLANTEVDVAYLDPPYNQHPYGSNYHVLNTVTLWDKPALSRNIANGDRGRVTLTMRGYKRYRVCSQRFSEKPMNVEILILVDTHRRNDTSADELLDRILTSERPVLAKHPECRDHEDGQLMLLGERRQQAAETMPA